MPAEHHIVAAELNPCIVSPFFIITPAPRNPMPVTTCDSTLRLSLFTGPPFAIAVMMTDSDINMNMQAPTDTSELVVRPA